MYDYGIPKLGYSFEYINLYETLVRSEKYSVSFFPYDVIMRKIGRKKMNVQLLNAIKDFGPDLSFFVLFTDEIMRETIKNITEKSGSITLNWFTDDHWRFQNYSRYWAPLFHWAVTTDSDSVEKYHRIGYHNIIESQWGFNHFIYKHYNIPQDYDVTFIGQVHSDRKNFIDYLYQSGIEVNCWGKGWKNGRLEFNEMVKMFSRSKINLNFTQSSLMFRLKPIIKIFLNRRADNSIHLNNIFNVTRNIADIKNMHKTQIKARIFEITGSGGFLLTQDVAHLTEYFVPGKEIEIFNDADELLEKIKYYLNNDEKRENIRRAGHKRAISEHSFEQRLMNIFYTLGLFNKYDNKN